MKLSNDFKETITSFIHETLEEYLYANIADFPKISNAYIPYYNALKDTLTDSKQRDLLGDIFEKRAEIFHHNLIGISIYAIKIFNRNPMAHTLSDAEIASIIQTSSIYDNNVYKTLENDCLLSETILLSTLYDKQLQNYRLYSDKYSVSLTYTLKESFKAATNIISQLENTYH